MGGGGSVLGTSAQYILVAREYAYGCHGIPFVICFAWERATGCCDAIFPAKTRPAVNTRRHFAF